MYGIYPGMLDVGAGDYTGKPLHDCWQDYTLFKALLKPVYISHMLYFFLFLYLYLIFAVFHVLSLLALWFLATLLCHSTLSCDCVQLTCIFSFYTTTVQLSLCAFILAARCCHII